MNNSAITEYIHFYQKNYDTWGINRVGTTKSSSLQASFSEIKNQIKNQSEINKLLKEAAKIEKDYNDLFFPKSPTDFSKILEEIAQETLEEEFGAAAGRINISNFDVVADQSLRNYKNKVKKVAQIIKVNNINKESTTRQILNTIKKLSEVLLQLDDNSNSVYIQNRIKIAKNELKQIKKRIEDETGVNKDLKFLKDIETINKFIQEFNRSFSISGKKGLGSAYNQRGDLFEWLSPLIQLKSTKLAGDELKKAMKDLVKSNNIGGVTTTIFFPDFLNMNDQQLSISISSEDFQMNVEDVRNRTDVIIKYPTGKGRYKEFAVSDKSITGKQIKLIDQTNLYRVLIFSENYDFIKHYLNIISWSRTGGKAPSAQIIQANRLVKSLTMQLAAQGFDINNPTELLIIHDVKQKRINVYNIKVLIHLIKKEILNGNNKYTNLIKVNGSKSFDDNFTIEQPFAPSVEQRLKFLFNEINAKKLTAHINSNQLKDYFKVLNNI